MFGFVTAWYVQKEFSKDLWFLLRLSGIGDKASGCGQKRRLGGWIEIGGSKADIRKAVS